MTQDEVMSGEMAEALNVYRDVLEHTANVFGAYATEKVMVAAVKAGEMLALESVERRYHAQTVDDSHRDDSCRTDPADG